MFRYRTSINFSMEQTKMKYDDTISHPLIIETYNNLLENYSEILEKCLYISIRVSTDNLNIWINFITKNKDINLEINKIPLNIYVNNKYIQGDEYVLEDFKLEDTSISIKQYQKPYSFFQVYKYIRLNIYEYLKNTFRITLESLVCIGGEFYIYSQILKYKSLKTYTDCNDLYRDALYNNPIFPVCFVDYNKDMLDLKTDNTENSLLILNVSRNGLKKKLLETISEWQGHIVYIGCKENIVMRDISILKDKQKKVVYYKNYDNNVFLTHLKN